MKSRALKIKKLAIDVAVILGLAMGAIALATHGLDTKLPSLF
jgi:orotate phosphoribosyltransferase